MKEMISFSIERVDGLGQGVSFNQSNGKVSFIPKTLPGETGKALITGKKGKKVQFAALQSLDTESESRIEPQCIHYKNCPGCSFLHTNYDKESELKKASYSFLFRRHFKACEITYTQAPRRLEYRNRVQLHYDKKAQRLGYRTDSKIYEVPHCLLPHPRIQDKMQELFHDKMWLDLTKDQPASGHIELYLKGDTEADVSIAINQRYAHDGFTQVFEEMNNKVIESIDLALTKAKISPQSNEIIVDLFGGDGNLSQHLDLPTLVVDYYTSPKLERNHQKFLSQNLYHASAINEISSCLTSSFPKDTSIAWLILDPPRSGLKNLEQYVSQLKPKKISYLSCNPNTQIRDITPLLESGWIIDSIEFLDLFPSTHHLESFVHLKKAH